MNNRFRVLALTRHGLTDQAQSGHALADAAEDARRLLDALGIERGHVAAHSMGGCEASALAARHPGRVTRIAYLDGAYDWADSPIPEWPEKAASPDRFASYEDYVDFVRSMLPDDVQGPALDAMLRASVDTLADGSVVDKHSVAALSAVHPSPKGVPTPLLRHHRPALAIFVHGGQWQGADAKWRVACQDRFTAETANAHVIELRASHYLFIDRRDDVLAAMRAFLT